MRNNVLFLNPPSYERFDSGGSRFQATRKTKSMWYPVWLCYAAAVLEKEGFNVKVIDATASKMNFSDILKVVKDYDFLVMDTSAPIINDNFKMSEQIKKENKDIKIVFVGPHVSTFPEETLKKCSAVDFVVCKEYEYPLLDLVKGIELNKIKGLVWKKDGKVVINKNREPPKNLDEIPFVSKIYKENLPIKEYRLPFVTQPYISIYTGRGCPYRCTFCYWTQTFTGRDYRARTIDNVIEEVKYVKKELPFVNEIFFDDDTFSVNKERVADFCDKIKPLNVNWSVNVRADLNYDLLKKMKESGCRVLVVGYESASQEILNGVKKGINVEQLVNFTKNAKKAGLMIHGTFVIGLPGETKETIDKTIGFAKSLNLDTLQATIAMPLPGTEFYEYCKKNNYLKEGSLINTCGYQACVVNYPNLNSKEIEDAVERFHIQYFFRPKYILKTLLKMFKNQKEAKRILRHAFEFNIYLLKKLKGEQNK